ncbi:MAG: hypothetical protein ACKO6Q_01810 [Bacteroidota bacterium]
MRIITLYLMGSFLWMSSVWAQSDSIFQFERFIQGEIRSFTADHLGNLYLIDRKDQVKKLNAKGDSLAVYNDVRRMGPLTGMDVGNPLQPMLYYGDGVRFVVLDRFLNPATRIDLQSSAIFQLQAWVRSYDNQIWLFDPLAYSLRKVDLTGKVQWSTPDFRQILGRPFQPTRMFDHERNLYLYEPGQGVYVVDYFGNLKNGIQIRGWQEVQVDAGFIYGRKADTLYRYEIKSSFYDEWILPTELKKAVQFMIRGKKMYALVREGEADRIRIYTIR